MNGLDPVNLIASAADTQPVSRLGGVASKQAGAASNAVTGETDGNFDATLREQLLKKAEGKLGMMTEKLVSTTFFQPMLAQMRDDPFKTDMFHGGFAEDAFGGQLDVMFADQMASRSALPAAKKITDSYMQWLQHQPIERIESVSQLDDNMFG